MKWQGPSPRALTFSLWGEHLDVVEELARELEARGEQLPLADIVRDMVRLYGPQWLEQLKGDRHE